MSRLVWSKECVMLLRRRNSVKGRLIQNTWYSSDTCLVSRRKGISWKECTDRKKYENLMLTLKEEFFIISSFIFSFHNEIREETCSSSLISRFGYSFLQCFRCDWWERSRSVLKKSELRDSCLRKYKDEKGSFSFFLDREKLPFSIRKADFPTDCYLRWVCKVSLLSLMESEVTLKGQLFFRSTRRWENAILVFQENETFVLLFSWKRKLCLPLSSTKESMTRVIRLALQM